MNEPVYYNNRKVLQKFVTSYSLILFIFLLMGFFFFVNGTNNVRDRILNQSYSLLERNISSFDTDLELMKTFTAQLAQNSCVSTMVYATEANRQFYYNASLATSALSSILPFQSLLPIENYYIYLPFTDYLLSAHSFTKPDLYYKHTKSFKTDLYEEWHDLLSSYNNTYTLLSLSSFSDRNSNLYLYKLPMAANTINNKNPGIVCFEFDKDGLMQLFSDLLYTEESCLFVVDENNMQLFTLSKTALTELPYSPVSLWERSQSEGTNQIFKQEQYTVITKTSANNNWTYCLIQPSDAMFEGLSNYQSTYFFIILLTCIMTFLMIYFLSKANVKPLITIQDQLNSSLVEHRTLEKALELQKPLVSNSYIARIMKGSVSTQEELAKITEFLQIDTEGKKFGVLYATLYLEQLEFFVEDSSNAEHAEASSPLSNYREMLTNCFFEYFGNDIYLYTPDVNVFALLIPTSAELSAEEYNEQIRSAFSRLHDYLLKEHSIWIFGGLGNRNSHLPYVWRSYQQALEAASFVRESNVFQVYSEIRRENEAYYYPFEMAGQLTNFIRQGNEKQIAEVFKLIKRENFEYRTLPLTTLKWLFSDIRNTLVKIRYSMPSETKNEAVLEQFDLLLSQHLSSIELLEKAALLLCTAFEQKQESNKLIFSIKQYIDENYQDPALSLKKISEEFDISESYFSYLFKAETKQNFSEYLEKLRMEQAMLLIKTTDIGLSELYNEVGYNNPNSFRRAFKKVHGVSPKIIRDSLEPEKDDTK